MPISIKTSGSWSNSTPYIKTTGSWSPAKQVFAKVNGTWQTVYTSAISDNFNRADSATLGVVPDSDYAWNDRRGLWQISGSAAYSSSLESSYPIADVDFSTQNVVIQATINPSATSQSSGKYGGGIAFWIVDSDNWWGAYNDVTVTTNTTYSCASTYNGKSLTSQVGTTCNYDYSATSTTTYETNCSHLSGSFYSRPSFARVVSGSFAEIRYNVCLSTSARGTYVASPGYCNTSGGSSAPATGKVGYYAAEGSGGYCYPESSWNSMPGYQQSNPTGTSYTCPSGGSLSGTTCLMSTSATGTTTSTYAHKLKLINSINSSIATVNTYNINDNTWVPANIKATINNNSITFNAYANDDNTGSSWTQSYTATSPNRGTKHGLLLAPKGDSAVTQATALDNFSLSAV